MMELQGAIGIAQLAKLDYMIAQQKQHKSKLRQAASAIPGIQFRHQIDKEGDSATFFAFMLSDKEHCDRVNTHLREKGVGAINFSENTWHFYPKWEHLLNGSTLTSTGWPFKGQEGKRRVVYDPNNLPNSAQIMQRTLVYQIPVKMTNESISQICDALEGAARI